MTITLHWWTLVPAALVIAALFFGILGSRRTGMLGGLGEAMLSCVLLVMAVMVCIGHWL